MADLRPDDLRELKRLDKAFVTVALHHLRERGTKPELALISLLRVCRVLLRKLSTEHQKELLPLLVAFLQGKASEPGTGLIWMPEVPHNLN